jgi:hypothetical protein
MSLYQQGKVYAIICRKTNIKYIGSTCEPTLSKRLAQHRSDYRRWEKTGKKNMSSFDIIKNDDFHIVLLELYPCNSKDELRMCEQKHINLNECINKLKAFLTEEELLQYQKEWYDANKEQISKKTKEYQQTRKEQISEYHKKYSKENKEQINEYQKKYAKERICCSHCQKELNKGSLKRHIKTQH